MRVFPSPAGDRASRNGSRFEPATDQVEDEAPRSGDGGGSGNKTGGDRQAGGPTFLVAADSRRTRKYSSMPPRALAYLDRREAAEPLGKGGPQ